MPDSVRPSPSPGPDPARLPDEWRALFEGMADSDWATRAQYRAEGASSGLIEDALSEGGTHDVDVDIE